MSYHDNRSSRGVPRDPDDGTPHDRLFYVFLLGAAAFVLMIWVAVAFERNQPAPPPPKPLAPVIVKMPERVEPPAPAPSNQAEKINTPDPAPITQPDEPTVPELRPSIDTPPAQDPDSGQSTEPKTEQKPAELGGHDHDSRASLPAASHDRNGNRRHHHHGQRRLHHHWASDHLPMPGCEPLCEFFKGTARGAGLIP